MHEFVSPPVERDALLAEIVLWKLWYAFVNIIENSSCCPSAALLFRTVFNPSAGLTPFFCENFKFQKPLDVRDFMSTVSHFCFSSGV